MQLSLPTPFSLGSLLPHFTPSHNLLRILAFKFSNICVYEWFVDGLKNNSLENIVVKMEKKLTCFYNKDTVILLYSVVHLSRQQLVYRHLKQIIKCILKIKVSFALPRHSEGSSLVKPWSKAHIG